MLNFRTIYGMISDVDLKECYFMRAWGYRDEEFVLANWQKMSIEEMRDAVRSAHKLHDDTTITYPPSKVDVDSLRTKKAILDAYRELTYVPGAVYRGCVAGGFTQRMIDRGDLDVGYDSNGAGICLSYACMAGLDASVIRGLAEKCGADKIASFAPTDWGAAAGRIDMIDLFASEFGAEIDAVSLTAAAERGYDAVIDHLVGKYGLDPHAKDEAGWTALESAVRYGHVRTVMHLVEVYNADIHAICPNVDHNPLIGLAAAQGHIDVVDLAASKYGAKVDQDCLFLAVDAGQLAMIDHLVQTYGLVVGAQNSIGWTAMHVAIQADRIEVVRHLVEKHKFDVNAKQTLGMNVLQMAERFGRREIAAYLRKCSSSGRKSKPKAGGGRGRGRGRGPPPRCR